MRSISGIGEARGRAVRLCWRRAGPAIVGGLVLLAVAGSARRGSADEPTGPDIGSRRGPRSLHFSVGPTGGAFEVPVHPAFVTLLQFPDRIVRAQASDRQSFSITAAGDSVSVRAKSEAAPVANLNVVTAKVRVSVILRVVPRSRAATLATFAPATTTATGGGMGAHACADRARRARELARRDCEREASSVAGRVDREIARRLLERAQLHDLAVTAASDGAVALRIDRAAWVGPDIHLFFAIQNRTARVYRFGEIRVTWRGTRLLTAAVLAGGERQLVRGGPDSYVAGGGDRRGIVMIPNATRLRGQEVVLTVVAANRGRAIIAGKIRVP